MPHPTERFSVDAYVVDALLPDLVGHDRRPSAFLVYLYLWRKSGAAARATAASLRMIADATGLSKRAVQAGVATLARRQLVSIVRKSPTATPIFTLRCHWRAR